MSIFTAHRCKVTIKNKKTVVFSPLIIDIIIRQQGGHGLTLRYFQTLQFPSFLLPRRAGPCEFNPSNDQNTVYSTAVVETK